MVPAKRVLPPVLLAAALMVACGLPSLADGRGLAPPSSWHLGTRLGNILAQPLVRRFPRAEIGDPATITGLVVLGGGYERLREAGRLARAWPHLRVFVSGAGPEAVVWQALGPGIEPERVRIETISTTTFENAVNSWRMLAPEPDERWLLVTSAVHMTRAMGAFRAAGFEPEPWPVYDLHHASAHALDAATHEWLGLGWYWLLARASALYPAPSGARTSSP